MAYDGYEDGTYDLWTLVDLAGGTVAVAEAAAKNGVYGVRYTTDGANDSIETDRLYNTDANDATGNYYSWVRFSALPASLGYWIIRSAAVVNIAYFYVNGSTLTYAYSGGTANFTEALSANTWYRFRVRYDAANKIHYYLYDADNVLIEEHLNNTALSTANVGWIGSSWYDKQATPMTIDMDDYTYTDTEEPTPPSAGGMMTTRTKWWGDI